MMNLPLNVDFSGKVVVVTGAGGVLCGDMARAFAASLGVEAKFQLIDWDSKVMELEGKTLGLIGTGNIGKLVAKKAAYGFDMKVLAYDPFWNEEYAAANHIVKAAPEEIYAQADVISLHLPLTEETRGTISKKELEMMKPDAILINTARGGLIDEDALLDALIRAFPGSRRGRRPEGDGLPLGYVHAGGEGVITLPPSAAHMPVGALQDFLDRYLMDHKGRVDYIHGEEVAREFAARPGDIAFLLPPMDKRALFPTVIHDGALPRKTFSMGEPHDKRFYLEARRIR